MWSCARGTGVTQLQESDGSCRLVVRGRSAVDRMRRFLFPRDSALCVWGLTRGVAVRYDDPAQAPGVYTVCFGVCFWGCTPCHSGRWRLGANGPGVYVVSGSSGPAARGTNTRARQLQQRQPQPSPSMPCLLLVSVESVVLDGQRPAHLPPFGRPLRLCCM